MSQFFSEHLSCSRCLGSSLEMSLGQANVNPLEVSSGIQHNHFNLLQAFPTKPFKCWLCLSGSHACLYDLLCSETPRGTLQKDFQTSTSGNS